jgi:hypothetical protein
MLTNCEKLNEALDEYGTKVAAYMNSINTVSNLTRFVVKNVT